MQTSFGTHRLNKAGGAYTEAASVLGWRHCALLAAATTRQMFPMLRRDIILTRAEVQPLFYSHSLFVCPEVCKDGTYFFYCL